MYIDTHCHIFKEEYDELEKVIKGIEDNIIINAGTNTKTNKEIIEMINYSNIYGVIGIHPEEIKYISQEDYLFLEKNVTNKKIVGIGEIGLDYYWNKENKETQKEVFIKQILIAKKYNKPIVVHSRDSIEDTYYILEKYAKGMKIVLHCYSGSKEMANKFLELGIMFGIGGVVTFKNGKKLKEVVEVLPLSNILLETDSPYLTPEP